MKPLQHPLRHHSLSDWPTAAKSILVFWLFYLMTVVARALLGGDAEKVIENRVVVIAVGIGLTFAIYLAIASLGKAANLRRRAAVAVAASFIAAGALSGFMILADKFQDNPHDEFHYVSKEGYHVTEVGNEIRINRDSGGSFVVTWPKVSQLPPHEQLRIAADIMVSWLFFFAAWSAYYLATLAQAQALTAQRRASEAESAAQSAQLRALRYQINPHFLFNTLNSLSSLVMTGRSDRAEAMLLALSTFFRSSLSLDPSADVSLAEEIALQRLYLDIETTRFPDRLQVEIDVPAELDHARLPALLLQPIVENAIKYGVSKSRKAVVIRIEARKVSDGRMLLEISNRLKNGGKPELPAATHEGTGVGLANVCQRLETRFGSRASCLFGPMTDGGYKVSLKMPVETRG